MTPERVGPYRIVRHIGAGGIGDVFEAVHEELGRPVALKLLKPGAVQGADATRRFRREMQTAAALSHPNLVRIYDGGQIDGTLYMAMELVSGETLADWLARERPAVAWCVRVAREVADGLACLHAREILHRDVKPQNILLEKNGTAKLADFGLVRTLEATAITTDGSLLGTLPFLAPELITGAAATPGSDLWALGCVLYAMLCGRGPFTAEGPGEWLQAITRAPIPPVEALAPQVPPALARVVARLLERRPGERLASATEVSAKLASLSDAVPAARASRSRGTAAPRSGPGSGTASRPAGSDPVRRGLAALGVAVAVGFCVAGGYLLSGARHSPLAPPPLTPVARSADPRAPGQPEWTRDVIARAASFRDPRQAETVVLDALEAMGHAGPEVPWPHALDNLAVQDSKGVLDRLGELRRRGAAAYERATLEAWGDVPRRERAYANEFRAVVRDVRAILPCAMRRDAPFKLLVNAATAVGLARQTEFRLLDEASAVAMEKHAQSLCNHPRVDWREPYLFSFCRPSPTESTRVADRREALAMYESQLAVRPGRPGMDQVILWIELVSQAMVACEAARDRAAGEALMEHAMRARRDLPPCPESESGWMNLLAVHQSVMHR